LGKPCMVCYAVLCQVKTITARGLAKLLKRGHVRDHLATLKRHGLAMLDKRFWAPIIVPVEYLDQLAQPFRLNGKGGKQKANNAAQRRAYRDWVKAGKPTKGWPTTSKSAA